MKSIHDDAHHMYIYSVNDGYNDKNSDYKKETIQKDVEVAVNIQCLKCTQY